MATPAETARAILSVDPRSVRQPGEPSALEIRELAQDYLRMARDLATANQVLGLVGPTLRRLREEGG